MQYIVLDLEWNQPWPGSPSSKKVLPSPIRGEIIQIGAVRLSEDQQVIDEFTQLVMPKYYRRLNRRVSSLTGIKEARLKEEGIVFLIYCELICSINNSGRRLHSEHKLV